MVTGLFDARYQIIESIGRGQTGEVFRARDTLLDRTVALRIFPQGQGDSEDSTSFFENARAAARLDHPGLCAVFDVSDSGERPYVVEAFVCGKPLSEMTTWRPTPEWTADIGFQIASAIHAARQQGLVFRELSAHNVIVGELPGGESVARIADFSFAPASLGRDGGLAGLGVILYSLLTGEVPDAETARRKLAGSCPQPMAEVVARLLAADETGQYPSAQEVMAVCAAHRRPLSNLTQLMTMSTLATGTGKEPGLADEPWREPGDRYEDIGPIGEGGMGEVRRVRDRFLNRTVAMKILKVSGEGRRERFLEEACISARLQHPAIVPVHDIGTLADGRLFFTMKEVVGNTFKSVIREAHESWAAEPDADHDTAQPLRSLSHLVNILQRVCEGVAYAHRQGVLHRDLKPSNIMIGDFGEVLVLDWGLTRLFDAATRGEPLGDRPARAHSSSDSMLTVAGTVTGTPAYMSPEQAMGDASLLTVRSDVYSLGAVLYTVLSGEAPYQNDPTPVRLPVLQGPPRPLGDRPFGSPHGPLIPADLKAICERAMERNPQDRYADGGELAQALAAWTEGARRHERASEIVNSAAQMKPVIARLRAEAEQLDRQAGEMLLSIPPFAPVDYKRPAWEMQDKAKALKSDADLAEIRFAQLVRGALTHAADSQVANLTLAEHYRDLHARAEAARDSRTAAQLEILLRDYDDGRSAAYLKGTGALTLHTNPPRARALLYRYEEWDRRLQLRFLSNLGETPIVRYPLEMGSYLVKLSAPERAEVNYPVFIDRGRLWDGCRPGSNTPHAIYLPAKGELGADESYIPAGWFWSGGDRIAPNSLPDRRLWLDGFVLPKFMVTIGEYLEFLNSLVTEGREDEAAQHAPPKPPWEEEPASEPFSEVGFVRDASGCYRVDAPEAKLRWPVSFVTWSTAKAYADWRARTTGMPWRLPHEMEYEKAARGADAREFPWGHFLDPTFCVMRFSHQTGRAGKYRVDEYPADESPYGIRGLAGNLHTWCEDAYSATGPDIINDIPRPPDPAVVKGPGAGGGHRLIRGGSFRFPEEMCRAAFREAPPAIFRDTVVGIRVARSI